MKKLTFILLLSISSILARAQVCGKPSHAAISLTGASNQVISDIQINPGSSIGIKLTNCSNITITRVKITGSSNSTGAIDLENCHDITIYQCELDSSIRGVYVHSCTNNIIIVSNWMKDILDPYVDTNPPGQPHPNGGGNSVQLSLTNGTGIKIDSNFIYHTSNTAFNGDNISCYKSAGTSSSRIKIWYNQIYGGGSQTTSLGKAGIAIGDNPGSNYQDVEFNLLKNTGSAGIVMGGGIGHIVSYNQIYSDPLLPYSEGIIFGAYIGGSPSTDAVVSNNKMNWRQANGNAAAKYWDTSNGNTVQPVGWTTNTADGGRDLTVLSSILPTPLFSPCILNPVISYSGPFVYTYGSTIINVSPVNTGGAAVSYSITSGLLPAGLSFNTITGVISGTPTSLYSTGSMAIQATNASGSSSTSVTITVNKAVLTIVPNLAFKFQGQANPTFTASYAGFQLSDNVGSLSTPATVSTTAITSSPAGNYTLTASGAAATNYSFTYNTGLFIILPTTIGVVIHTPVMVLTH